MFGGGYPVGTEPWGWTWRLQQGGQGRLQSAVGIAHGGHGGWPGKPGAECESMQPQGPEHPSRGWRQRPLLSQFQRAAGRRWTVLEKEMALIYSINKCSSPGRASAKKIWETAQHDRHVD